MPARPTDDADRAVSSSSIFPPIELADADGLLAFGDALTPEWIVGALVRGIFPWTIALSDDEEPFDDEDGDAIGEFENANAGQCRDLGETNFDICNELDASNVCSSAAPRSDDALLDGLSARTRGARWGNFNALSLKTFDETGEVVGWWSPNPRAIFELDDFRVSRRLERTIRGEKFRVSFDEAFPETMLACASAKNRATTEGTWITREFYASYCRLFELGFAHSAECWLGERLVGGVYGVAINGFFDGESMFSVERDASKVALTALIRRLKERGFQLFDLQILNPHTASLGGKEIPRDEYLRRLDSALRTPVRFG